MGSLNEVTVAAKTGGESVVGGSGSIGDDAVFVLSRPHSTAAALEVDYTLGGDSSAYATPGDHGSSGMASIPANQDSVEVAVRTTPQAAGTSFDITLTVNDPGDNTYAVATAPGNVATVTVTAPPNPATGEPAITGAAEEGVTLMAAPGNITDGDGLTGTTYTYTWYRQDADGTNRSANAIHMGTSYRLVMADADKQIVVVVSFTDDAGFPESRESSPYPMGGTVAANVPATGKPAISGFASVGQALTASPGAPPSGIADGNGLSGATYTYEWYRQDTDGSNRSASAIHTGNSYLLVAADVGKQIVVIASFADDNTNEESRESDPFPMSGTISANTPSTGTPEISGVASVGETLMALTDPADIAVDFADADGLPAASAYTYQWVREDRDGSNQTDIAANADGSSYTLVGDDGGKRIRVRVSFTDSLGGTEALLSDAYPSTGTVSALSTGQLAITGTVVAGAELTADTAGIMDPNGLTSVAYIYQWQRADDAAGTGEADIDGATSQTYTLTKADDQDKFIRVSVTFMDDDGNDETKTSDWTAAVGKAGPAPATGDVTIDDGTTAQVDIELTADTSAIDDPANGLTAPGYTYQWQRADDAAGTGEADIDDETSQTYTPTKADDQGKFLRVVVTFTDDDGYGETKTSAWTSAVTRRANSAATGALTVSGTVKAGESLSADATAVADANGTSGATFTYQWQRQSAVGAWADIGTTTSSTYTAAAADIGMRLRVQVSFADDDGYPESVTSDATAPITAAANNLAMGAPEVGGPARVGQMLQAATQDVIDDEDGLGSPSYAYQWQRGVPGAVIAWSNIRGETSSTYTLTAADEGMKVRVKVAFPDARGNLEELPSAPYPRGSETVVPADASGLAPGEGGAAYPGALAHAVAGFGHSVAAGIVDGIWDRAAARQTGSLDSRVTLGGKTLVAQTLSSRDAGQAVREAANLFGLEATEPDGPYSGLEGGHGGGIDYYREWADIPDRNRLASQSSFALTAGNGAGKDKAAFWGELSTAARESEPGEGSSVETESSNMLLGFDLPGRDNVLYGLVISRSSGESDYRDASTATATAGTAETSLTTFAPFVHWTGATGRSFWGSLGIGSGSLETTVDGSASETDVGMTMLAAGVKGNSMRRGKGEISIRADVFRTAITADSSADFSELSAEASRIRVALERVSARTMDSGAVSSNRLELGARMDSGDGEEGAGADVAAEIRYAALSGLEVSARLSSLLLHSQEGFSEWGAGLGVAYSTGSNGRGVSLSLEPLWNVPRTGVAESMWGSQDLGGYAASDAGAAMKARFGYGAGTLRDQTLATLYGETESGDDSRRLRLGAEIRGLADPLERLRLDVYGEHEDGQASGPNDSIMLEVRLGL